MPLFETLYTLNDLKSGKALYLSGLKGSSWAYLFAHLFRESGESIIVLVPDSEMAESAFTDLSFFIEPTLSHPSTFQDRKVFLYPFWETLPYEDITPYPDIVNRRIETLFRLLQGPPIVLVTTPRAIMQKVIRKEALTSSAGELKVGDEIDRDIFIEKLIRQGFQNVDMVEGRGEIGVRGGIIDIFSPGYSLPIRFEFMGDCIESIRLFDPATQRSEKKVEGVTIFPVRESLPNSHLSSFLDYLSDGSFLCLHDQTSLEDEASRFEEEINEGFKTSVGMGKKPSEPDKLYLSKKGLFDALSSLRRIFLDTFLPASSEDVGPVEEISSIDISSEGNIDLRQRVNLKKEDNLLEPLAKRIKGWQEEGRAIYFVTITHGHAERFRDLLAGYNIETSPGDRSQIISLPFDDLKPGLEHSGPVNIIEGRINSGFRIPSIGLAIITEEEIFGRRVKRRSAPARKVDELIDRMKELRVGDLVVHALHGIGIYGGLAKLAIGGYEGDFLLITYQADGRLYVPVYRLDLVQKYIGGEEGDRSPIDRLGGQAWGKAKKKVKEDALKVARELLEIYAARKALKGFAFSVRDRFFHEFEESFEYEETPDQAKAIEDTLSDMESPGAMDRLICGDVGYGKTEVALRASFKAAIDGKQVAFLAPTTILAQQHYQTFKERLAPYPFNVEVLSRFKRPKEQKDIIKRLSIGGVDILIGTQRIIQKDVVFKDLGLVIIDEEQRFGVSHKEKLKKMRKLVDTLTLTATPIPRTFHMSIVGVRDLSIINTPPEDRLSIKTLIARFDGRVIRGAVIRELDRGGQVFFVHNRVQSIESMYSYLKGLLPEVRICVAHGQMKERDLEKVMHSFIAKKYDILISTSIIESGLDIPSANTIIINRADKFGLAQLYQLRGRVGRSNHRAYAYLLVPPEAGLTRDAKKRLRVLKDLTDLGSGFKIASYDLEIRGAGELLGTAQSGQVARVGFDMYTKLLEQAVRELKGEEYEEEIDVEMKVAIPSYIPEQYIPDTRQRLTLYKRLASAESASDIDDMKDEVSDRYGEIPEQVENLLGLMKARCMAKALRITEVVLNGNRLILTFHERSAVSTDFIVDMVTREPKRFHLSPDHRLTVILKDRDKGHPLEAVGKFLQSLMGNNG